MVKYQLIKRLWFLLLVYIISIVPCGAFALDDKIGIGVKAGMGRLEGDWSSPGLSFNGSVFASYSPFPYFSISGELGTGFLRTSEISDINRIDAGFDNVDDYSTTFVPYELQVQVNPFPYFKIKPFALLGVGGLWFNSTYQDATINLDGVEQNLMDSYIKFGGGIEYPIEPRISVMLGADFRQTMTDRLEQWKSGDENDGIISVWAGVTYYFPLKNKDDRDFDNIPLSLDVDPIYAEDFNGYQDHDGRPENGVPENFDYKKPLVKHNPVFRALEGSNLEIKAEIYSTTPLKSISIMHRAMGSKKWQVVEMSPEPNNVYVGEIDKSYITGDGLEYFVVAVTRDLQGMGYSGLPKRPIQVKVVKNAPKWRLATGALSALSWASALYIILRKQTN